LGRPDPLPKMSSVAPDSGGAKPQIELIADEYHIPLHWNEQQWARSTPHPWRDRS
jgi:hypothetical protein